MIPGLVRYTPRQQEVIDRCARDPAVAELMAHVLGPAAAKCTEQVLSAPLGIAAGRAEACRLQGAVAFYQGLLASFEMSLKK